jgi:hypothetical protein
MVAASVADVHNLRLKLRVPMTCSHLTPRVVQLKVRDAKNIRRLAQEVLLQRSDTEMFFISSLDHVRRMIKEGDGSNDVAELPKDMHVDIADLTWSQREQVLRLAFARINQQARTMQLRQLPFRSFQEAIQQSRTARDGEPLSGLVSGASKPKMA